MISDVLLGFFQDVGGPAIGDNIAIGANSWRFATAEESAGVTACRRSSLYLQGKLQ